MALDTLHDELRVVVNQGDYAPLADEDVGRNSFRRLPSNH